MEMLKLPSVLRFLKPIVKTPVQDVTRYFLKHYVDSCLPLLIWTSDDTPPHKTDVESGTKLMSKKQMKQENPNRESQISKLREWNQGASNPSVSSGG